jgi:Hydroxyethylthiazole kinase family
MTIAAVVAISAPTIDAVVEAHAALRAKRPLVQALTNIVSSNFVANVLLSAGASPAMVDNPEEAALFAGIADAVLINLGTPTAAQVESMRLLRPPLKRRASHGSSIRSRPAACHGAGKSLRIC